MKTVVRMHFVCRNATNVTILPDGNFETGVWKVAAKWAFTVKTIALHQNKESMSYLQGEVIDRRPEEYLGKIRYIFTVRPSQVSLAWQGDGTGEKGYVYG